MSLSPRSTNPHGLLSLQLSTRRLLPKRCSPAELPAQRSGQRSNAANKAEELLFFPPIPNTEQSKLAANAQHWSRRTINPQFRVCARFNEPTFTPKAKKPLKKVMSHSQLEKPQPRNHCCTQICQTDFPLDEYDSWAAEDFYYSPSRAW
jgi:hypothetical protein